MSGVDNISPIYTGSIPFDTGTPEAESSVVTSVHLLSEIITIKFEKF